MIRAGRDLAPFLTRHARCAPVAANVTQRAMEKKLRSARFTVPGRRAPARRSTSACSLTVLESRAAASTRRVPQATRVTSLACGNRPPEGVANRSRTAAVSARSTTVPSTAVTTRPNARSPATSTRSAAATASNSARSTPAGRRALACDNAAALTPGHIQIVGLTAPSNGHNRASTAR